MNFNNNYDFNANQCIIEQYKIYLEMLEGSTKRRMDTNSFFISVNALMVTITSFFNQGNIPALVLVCVTGLLFSWIWHVLLCNYNVVNKAKWDVVNEMEAHLQCNPFESEWPKMQNKKYASISVLERRLPIVFGVVYAAIGLYGAWFFFNGAANPVDLTAAIAEVNDSLGRVSFALAEIARTSMGG